MPLTIELSRTDDEIRQRFSELQHGRDVADLLEVPYEFLTYALYWGANNYPYRTFSIPKRSGEPRQIAAPANSIGILQTKLNHILSLVYAPRPAVHGFVSERSVVTNAMNHVGKAFVLNVDLKDFFPSINFGRVRGMLMARPYSVGEHAATFLAQLCCNEGYLPQGAPTSPIISNMVCSKLDGDLQRLAKKYRCTYSRYADDLTFSTTSRRFPEELATPESAWAGPGLALGDELLNAIRSNGFAVNQNKKRLLPRSSRQEVTGLTVNRFPNLRRRYSRQLRAMLRAWEEFGLDAAGAEHRTRYRGPNYEPEDEGATFARVVKGKLDYLRMVKGEGDGTFRRLANWLNQLDPNLIGEFPETPHDADQRWTGLFAKLRASVFQLEVVKDGDTSAGTAFSWDRRTVATAAHCLDGEVRIYILSQQSPVRLEKFAFHPSGDARIDAALARLPDGVELNPPFSFRRGGVSRGELVAAIGFPSVPGREPDLGIYPGHIESTMPFFGGDVDCVQVTIELSGGLSGGPVIDRGGKLVGIAMETSFEQTEEHVPARPFRHVLPIRYVREIHFDD